jgi:hypothetical protein
MNREQIHQQFAKVKTAFQNVDVNFRNVDIHIGEHLRRMLKIEKEADRIYLENLTWHMMWDCLMNLLSQKGVLTKDEFDAGLAALQEATKVAMEAEAKKRAEEEAAKLPPEGKVTVLSDVPAIPVVP